MNVARRRIIGRNEETIPRPAAPAAKTRRGRIIAGMGIEHSEIDDAIVSLRVAHRHVDACRVGGNIDGHVEIWIGGLISRGHVNGDFDHDGLLAYWRNTGAGLVEQRHVAGIE